MSKGAKMIPNTALPAAPVLVTPLVQRHIDIIRECEKLEALRVSEIDIHADLVSSLNILAYFTEQTKFKVETRQTAKAVAALTRHIHAVQDAEQRLLKCHREIDATTRRIERLDREVR